MSETLGLMLRSAAATTIVVGLLFALQWLVKRRVPFRPRRPWRGRGEGRLLEVLETSYLPEGASLHLVRIGTRRFVVGRSSASITFLCTVPDERQPRAIQFKYSS